MPEWMTVKLTPKAHRLLSQSKMSLPTRNGPPHTETFSEVVERLVEIADSIDRDPDAREGGSQ